MRKFFKKIFNYFKRLKVIEQKLLMQQAEIEELKEFMKTAKEFQQRKNLKVDKTKKWLNSYPDETKSVHKRGIN